MTEKQKIFADEYLIDLNATRAYRAAYPNCKKDSSADAAARKLLGNTRIQTYITERMEERQKRTEITQDMVLQELAAIAFARATDYVSVMDGMVQVKDTDQLSDSQIAAIAGIKETQNGIEVKLGSKEKTLELLGRHLGMWNDKLDVAGDMDMKIVVDYGDGDETS
ncbi:terminase small subunit [Mediterraneibacter gnavus]|uniref:Terminase small subunit n=1 Tax=Mediterraneibacter gnavus TaxID=33038 RepID=A0AAJ3FH33_MEDGN|nr:terminase small subunit [Mediterraneibacter gnavus]NSC84534.1 terminase small subunit [Mediterraneibacter gnavus]NSI27422.1 terminase small subunit [Mediterraneibacter gnavus]NSI30901.1 terminase small subunit [Mediterraneibacter gnavus]NSI46837.1 terminase small subunit [Mediterraneibacter gnavus]NSI50264.1 terminase small subunit [Mediterraneibacter gnavus]